MEHSIKSISRGIEKALEDGGSPEAGGKGDREGGMGEDSSELEGICHSACPEGSGE